MKINLEAKSQEQKIILNYLENNASDTLINKINNGVKISKDDATLINKKDLDGFMQYANGEARKLAEKGSNCACVEDNIVFGWAVHYFEEDSIEGTLYQENGTIFKPNKQIKQHTTEIKKPEPKKVDKQPDLFDFMIKPTPEDKVIEKVPEFEEDPHADIFDDDIPYFEETKPKEMQIENITINTETGEVLSNNDELYNQLNTLLDGKIIKE